MRETLQDRIEESGNIVDISVYEQEWIKPDADFSKGRLIRRAIVTHVHTGKIPMGTRLEFTHLTVEGELRTLFFNNDETVRIADGKLEIQGDGHWGFKRVGDTFAELFEKELESNPTLRK